MNGHKEIIINRNSINKSISIGAFGSTAVAHADAMSEDGQCHGINACKGKGDCSGKANECEGHNDECKGWVNLSKEDCEKNPKGHWEAMPKKH